MGPPYRDSRQPHLVGHHHRSQGTVLILPQLPHLQSVPILLLHRGSLLLPLKPIPLHHKLVLRHRPAPHRILRRPLVIQLGLLLRHNLHQPAALLILLRRSMALPGPPSASPPQAVVQG